VHGRTKDLERDGTLEAYFQGAVDARKATAPEDRFDAIRVLEDLARAGKFRGHWPRCYQRTVADHTFLG